MGELADRLGNKEAGFLIRFEDWNELVAAVDNVQEVLLPELEARLQEELDRRLGEAESRLDSIESDIQRQDGELARLVPLLGEFYRLEISTARVRYAYGEVAEIEARVRSLEGGDLTFGGEGEAERPWVDFIATWGKIRAVPGFESRGGEGDRTLSVRADANGIVRLRLQAETAEGVDEETETAVADSLTTRTANSDQTVAELFLAANTPTEPRLSAGFQIVSAEYERSDSFRVRNYLDTFYRRSTAFFSPNFLFRPRVSWRDYRATLTAFVKADADPTTPDFSRGTASIQITFRDWISPWIFGTFLATDEDEVTGLSQQFAGQLTVDLEGSSRNWRQRIRERVGGRGLLGRQRALRHLGRAIERVPTTGQPAFLTGLKRSYGDAVALQEVLNNTQATTLEETERGVALDALSDAALRADVGTEAVRTEVLRVEGRLEQVDGRVGTTEGQLSALSEETTRIEVESRAAREQADRVADDVTRINGQVLEIGERATRADSQASVISARFESVETQLVPLRNLDVGNVIGQLGVLDGVVNRVEVLERRR